jgi:hypothetical protein
VPGGNGVFGLSTVPNASGVFGANNNGGTGVFGISVKGVGIRGVGQIAGHFDGNVEIGGKLTVNGIDVVQLLLSLQQMVSPPSGTPPGKPNITVTSEGSGKFTVSGTAFLPSKTVHIRVVDQALNNVWFDQSSDSAGHLNAKVTLSCQTGVKQYFSVNDGRPDSSDLTGVLWSNTFTITC